MRRACTEKWLQFILSFHYITMDQYDSSAEQTLGHFHTVIIVRFEYACFNLYLYNDGKIHD